MITIVIIENQWIKNLKCETIIEWIKDQKCLIIEKISENTIIQLLVEVMKIKIKCNILKMI